jgi:hypothetical protein
LNGALVEAVEIVVDAEIAPNANGAAAATTTIPRRGLINMTLCPRARTANRRWAPDGATHDPPRKFPLLNDFLLP